MYATVLTTKPAEVVVAASSATKLEGPKTAVPAREETPVGGGKTINK